MSTKPVTTEIQTQHKQSEHITSKKSDEHLSSSEKATQVVHFAISQEGSEETKAPKIKKRSMSDKKINTVLFKKDSKMTKSEEKLPGLEALSNSLPEYPTFSDDNSQGGGIFSMKAPELEVPVNVSQEEYLIPSLRRVLESDFENVHTSFDHFQKIFNRTFGDQPPEPQEVVLAVKQLMFSADKYLLDSRATVHFEIKEIDLQQSKRLTRVPSFFHFPSSSMPPELRKKLTEFMEKMLFISFEKTKLNKFFQSLNEECQSIHEDVMRSKNEHVLHAVLGDEYTEKS